VRYFSVVLNPQSPEVLAGPGGNSVVVRMRHELEPGGPKMTYCTFVDGGYVAVPDQEMGRWAGAADTVVLDPINNPYRMWQESVPQIQDLGAIPVWTTQLVPYSTDPQVQPTPWPTSLSV
jgi:hypothetical protein